MLASCAFLVSGLFAHRFACTAAIPAVEVEILAQTEAEVERVEALETESIDVRLLQKKLGLSVGPSGSVSDLSTSVHEALEPKSDDQRTSAVIWPFGATRLSNLSKVCWGDEDCCPSDKPGSCALFCREGTEIDQSNAKGWEVRGVCTQKWEGFCLEDEECLSGHICQRSAGSLAGTCMRDTLCDTVFCGRGHCRWGTCTCNYGVTGERCEHSLEAFAFLFYGNNTENLVSTRVLIKSLRAAGAPQDIIAIVPKNLANVTPPELLEILVLDGVNIHFSEPISMPASMDADVIIHKRWAGVMNKFAVWQLTNYSQVALLDTDMVFSFDSENPERIFSECQAPLCAVQDGDSRFLNAGVLVITPSRERLYHLIHVLKHETHHFAMPEQSFLTQYCQNVAYRMPLQYLSRKWNSCVGGGMLHNLGWESTGYNVLHSCSWTGKPPNMRLCVPGACDQEDEWHTVLVWQFFHVQVDPCVHHVLMDRCASSGLARACKWCGHYCGDARIPCSAALFNQTRMRGADEPDIAQMASVWALSSHSTSPDKPKPATPEWTALPQGSWAWPQVAMYQILIDRFAAPNSTHCAKLDDYCGGTISGIGSKIDYLESLGVDGVVLSPVVDQMPHGYHGYWTKDLLSVNPQYGTEAEVKDLVLLFHERKMKAIIDVNLNHAGGPKTNASDPASVAELRPFDHPSHYHSQNCSLMHNADYERGPAFLEHCKLYGLPDYNQENPVVWQRLMRWVRSHVDNYGFDGIRVDAARHIFRPFLEHIPQAGPPIPAFFEVVNGDMKYVASYANGDYNAVYNYPLYFALREIFVPGPMQMPMSRLADWMVGNAEYASGRLMLNFLDNNDLPRFIYKLDGDQKLYHNALLCVLGMEGLPVLLYGSEQDQRGVLNFSDPLKVDNWRPPLWHAGYNTSSPTFQLIKKVLWLRRHLHGMHDLKQRALFADHKVMVFARGPVIFAVTNVGRENPVPSQRVLWDNATSDFQEPVWICDLLAIEPRHDCGLVAPGNLSRLHLRGDPKVYVPAPIILAYEEHLRREAQKERATAATGSLQVLAFSNWREIPGPPSLSVQMLPRTQRAWRPGDVVMNDDPNLIWHPFPLLPPHLDRWGPPLGMPTPHVVSVVLRDACFYLGAGEREGAIVAIRNATRYVLCPDSPDMCPEVMRQNVNLQQLQGSMATSQVPPGARPVVHVSYDAPQGLNYLLVSVLPSIAPFLPALRSGRMLAFFHTGKETVTPVLSRLGVMQSVFFPDAEAPAAKPYQFCTPELHFDVGTRPQHSRAQFVPGHLHAFREEVLPTIGHLPCAAKTGDIVLFSGDPAFGNELEVAAALRELGRPVTILQPNASAFLHVVETLSQASVLVGAHGASLAHMVYAPARVTVVEVVPQTPFGVDSQMRDLAGSLNFSYAVFGEAVRLKEHALGLAKGAVASEESAQSHTVDVQRLRSFVASLL